MPIRGKSVLLKLQCLVAVARAVKRPVLHGMKIGLVFVNGLRPFCASDRLRNKKPTTFSGAGEVQLGRVEEILSVTN
jgi:hypothetical protein